MYPNNAETTPKAIYSGVLLLSLSVTPNKLKNPKPDKLLTNNRPNHAIAAPI